MDDKLSNIRHERSKKDFPALKLEEGEYVEYAFSRSKICYFLIWGGAGIAILITIVAFLISINSQNAFIDATTQSFFSIIILALIAAIAIAALIATKVFSCNKLYITNRRAIQYVMLSPVVTSKNVIDLASIEDASFHQNSFFQKIFKIGTLRLSTVGDETTYTLQFVDFVNSTELNGITKLIRSNRNNDDGSSNCKK